MAEQLRSERMWHCSRRCWHGLKLIPICLQFPPELADASLTQPKVLCGLAGAVAAGKPERHMSLELLEPNKPTAKVDAAASNVGRICPAIVSQFLPLTAGASLEKRLNC